MEKEFVTYELAVKLKALGFDEPCFGKYLSSLQNDWKVYELILEMGMNEEFEDNRNIYLLEGACSAPTFSQAFRWLMQFPQIKKYRYNIALYPDGTYSLKDGKDSIYEYLSGDDCIDKLIEIVESKWE